MNSYRGTCGFVFSPHHPFGVPIEERTSSSNSCFDLQVGDHLYFCSRPMAGSTYEPIRGNKDEDVDHFLQRIELAAFNSNRDEDAAKLRLVSLLLEGQAREWYEDTLNRDQRDNWEQLRDALKERFGRVQSPEDLWRELSRIQQGEEEDITSYIKRFEACWRKIVRILEGNQAPPDFLKKDRFMSQLHGSIKDTVELKEPRTYDEAIRMARE